ncbi:ADP-ribosylglycohydrolase family protein [Peterkaempfera sp. SMS 1(5)a]
MRPPVSGHDNPHFFDDAACARSVVLAALRPGDAAGAAALAELDARYTQDGDGVYGARAIAAAVAAALGNAGTEAAVSAAVAELPGHSEAGRNAAAALDIARRAIHWAGGPGHRAAFAAVPRLEQQIIDHVYSYGVAAAETVPVALALTLAADGDIAAAVPAAASLSRIADSAPALTGALTGALSGIAALPHDWVDACDILLGCAHPSLGGYSVGETASDFAAFAAGPAVRTHTHTPGALPAVEQNTRLDTA